MVIVVVLPLPQLLIEQELLIEQVDIVGYPMAIEQLVELLVIHAMRAFDFAVEPRCPRADVDGCPVLHSRPLNLEKRAECVPSIGISQRSIPVT
jgi:hypothetical protein